MAKLTLNGTELEVPDGTQLVEAIKNSGEFISNLCYVDGLPPYAGCRKPRDHLPGGCAHRRTPSPPR